jgi:hypothetical protein
LFLSLITLNFAQFSPVLKGKSSLARFFNSTTCVVLTEDPCINEQLKRHFSESWKITPVQFILDEEFEIFLKDASYSFVHINTYKVQGEKKLVGAIALLNGGYTDRDLMYLNSTLAYVAYDNWGLEKTVESICKKIPAMVSQLKATIQLVNDNNIQGRYSMDITKSLIDIYNSKAYVLKTKTLLIDHLYKNSKIISEPEFAFIYKYDYQFVSGEEIEKAIANHENGKAVLFSSYNLYKINKVIDCSTHEIIFCEFEMSDNQRDHRLNQFDNTDMQLLNSTVKKAKEL